MSLGFRHLCLALVVAFSLPLFADTSDDFNEALRHGQGAEFVRTTVAKGDNFRDRELLRTVLAAEDKSLVSALTTYIFPKIRGLGIKYDILRAASFYPDAEERIRFMKKARALQRSGDNATLARMMDDCLNPRPPDAAPPGFTLEREFIGKGVYSYVSLVRRNSDGELFAWKRKTGAQARSGDAFRRHFNLFALWKDLGVAQGEMFLLVLPNGEETILHSFVAGQTVQKAQQETTFLSKENSPEFKALLEFFATLVRSHVMLLDLNTKNIVFDGRRWTVIDSQRPEVFPSAPETLKRMRFLIIEKWTNYGNGLANSDVSRFFVALESYLGDTLNGNDFTGTSKAIQTAKDVLANQDNKGIVNKAAVLSCSVPLTGTAD